MERRISNPVAVRKSRRRRNVCKWIPRIISSVLVADVPTTEHGARIRLPKRSCICAVSIITCVTRWMSLLSPSHVYSIFCQRLHWRIVTPTTNMTRLATLLKPTIIIWCFVGSLLPVVTKDANIWRQDFSVSADPWWLSWVCIVWFICYGSDSVTLIGVDVCIDVWGQMVK